MPLDKAANLGSVLEELEVFLAKTGPSSLAEKARSKPELLEWLFGASADPLTAETDADASKDMPRYGGLFGRLMEQLKLDTEYWRTISEQSAPKKGRSRSSNVWIARKWVHGAMVPWRLNQQRLWDPLEIVFDPADGSFAALNQNLIYGKLSFQISRIVVRRRRLTNRVEADFTKIALPRWQVPFDTITVFEDVVDPKSIKRDKGKDNAKGKKPEVPAAAEEFIEQSKAETLPPPTVFVAEGKRGPYKRGFRSARLQIVTFPLLVLGPVVAYKRMFRQIRSLYVLTSRAGREETMRPTWSPGAHKTRDKTADDGKGEASTLASGALPGPSASTAAGSSGAGSKSGDVELPALHELAAEGKLEALEKELEVRPKRIDELDFFGRTPLSWAAANGRVKVVEYLLGRKAAPDMASSNLGRTPLWWAAGSGHDEIVEMLLKADPKAKSDTADSQDKRTGLWWAARNGHKAVVKRLVEHGCDPTAKDKDGQSSIDVAKDDKIRELLNPSPTRGSGEE
jgi:hypothetical protein